MELDAIKLAKKLSASLQIVMIAKKDYFIDKQRNEYLGYNGIKLETISFKSSLSLSIILNVRKIIKQYGIKNIIFFGASELKSLYFSFLGLDVLIGAAACRQQSRTDAQPNGAGLDDRAALAGAG